MTKYFTSFNNEIKCQERPRMQDFAPFIPELLGTLSGPQTPGRSGTCYLMTEEKKNI
jgi:hypothetical protein